MDIRNSQKQLEFFHAKWNKDIWQRKKNKPKRYATVIGCHTFFCPKYEWVRMIFVLPTAFCCYITEKYANVILSKLHMAPNCKNDARLAQKPWKINENYKVFFAWFISRAVSAAKARYFFIQRGWLEIFEEKWFFNSYQKMPE